MAPQTAAEPRIPLLSLETETWFDEMYSFLIDALAAKATLQRASKPDAASRYLDSNHPVAILVTDPSVAKRSNAQLMTKIVEYVKSGGTVICMGLFSSFINKPVMDKFFFETWGLPWKYDQYFRTDVSVNNHGPTGLNKQRLEATYSQKAVFLKDVKSSDALYLPTTSSRTQSHVFAAENVNDLTITPVALAPLGRGHLGYVGDVNAELGSNEAIIVMCGL